MKQILKELDETKTYLIRRRANKDALTRMLDAEKKSAVELGAKVQELSDGISIVQNFSANLRSDIIRRFEELITRGVQQVFNRGHAISIEFSTSGNSVHADFFVALPDGKKINLANGEGGGLKDFVSVLQRILYLILEPNRPSKILFLDENLKALDSERSAVAFRFIVELTKELGIQVVFITHNSAARVISDIPGVNILEANHDGAQSQIRPMSGAAIQGNS